MLVPRSTTDSIAHSVRLRVMLWSVDGTIHIKTVSKYNDPVELTEDDAVELATLLARLASEG